MARSFLVKPLPSSIPLPSPSTTRIHEHTQGSTSSLAPHMSENHNCISSHEQVCLLSWSITKHVATASNVFPRRYLGGWLRYAKLLTKIRPRVKLTVSTTHVTPIIRVTNIEAAVIIRSNIPLLHTRPVISSHSRLFRDSSSRFHICRLLSVHSVHHKRAPLSLILIYPRPSSFSFLDITNSNYDMYCLDCCDKRRNGNGEMRKKGRNEWPPLINGQLTNPRWQIRLEVNTRIHCFILSLPFPPATSPPTSPLPSSSHFE